MAQKKNKKNKSGQLVRQNQNNMNSTKTKSNSNGFAQGRNGGGGMSLGSPTFGAPVAYSSPTTGKAPKISTSAKCTRIVHRELIATVNGNTTYGVTAYALNPGLSATFPWLYSVAGSFEQYSFRSLRFHYVTRCATSYTGSVLLSPEYDALDAAPSSEIVQAMMMGSVEDVPWRDQLISFSVPDMFPFGPRKFIRTGAVVNSDLKTYDVGQLFVGRAGCSDANSIGKLWVEYDVDLYIPQNPGSGMIGGIGSGSIFTQVASQAIPATTPTMVAFDTIGYDGITITNSGGDFTPPRGLYFVNANVTFSSTGTLSTCQLYIVQNNALTSPKYVVNSDFNTAIKGATLFVEGYVNCSGTDTVHVRVDLSGTGTFSMDTECSQIVFSRIG